MAKSESTESFPPIFPIKDPIKEGLTAMAARIGNHSRSNMRRGVRRTAKPKTTKTTKTPKRVYTAAELRKAFPNAKTENRVPLAEKDLYGNFSAVVKRLKGYAKAAGIKGDFEIGKRSVSTGRGYSRNSTQKLFLIGGRPYTDVELEAAGDKLVKSEKARIEREHKANVKRVQDYNRLASQLGQPLMAEPIKPTIPNLPI